MENQVIKLNNFIPFQGYRFSWLNYIIKVGILEQKIGIMFKLIYKKEIPIEIKNENI